MPDGSIRILETEDRATPRSWPLGNQGGGGVDYGQVMCLAAADEVVVSLLLDGALQIQRMNIAPLT
jgi:hypothetical protein